jgi:outer membrane biogenesis lipoprotein LolB
MNQSFTVLVPSSWVTGEPDEDHDSRVMAVIHAIEFNLTVEEENGQWGYLFVDYGQAELPHYEESVTELCFDRVWRGPGTDPRHV